MRIINDGQCAGQAIIVVAHIASLERSGLDNLNAGQEVKLDTEPGRRPGQINAVNIQTL